MKKKKIIKKKTDKKALGKRIKNIRKSRTENQTEFGRIFGANASNVSVWERGINLPNRERIKKIAEIGNITVEELLYGNRKSSNKKKTASMNKDSNSNENSMFDWENMSKKEIEQVTKNSFKRLYELGNIDRKLELWEAYCNNYMEQQKGTHKWNTWEDFRKDNPKGKGIEYEEYKEQIWRDTKAILDSAWENIFLPMDLDDKNYINEKIIEELLKENKI